MIVLRERPSAGYDRVRAAARWRLFRERYGMPFTLAPKARAAASDRGCRAVIAAALVEPGAEWRATRALQFAYFNSPLLLDDDEAIRAALRALPGLDADAISERLDDAAVEAEYRRQRGEARTAAGTAIETQGKHSSSDGPVRYTAPSVVFRAHGTTLVAGGWQTALSYDVVVANLDPALRVSEPPPSPAPLFERFPDGLTTAEVATLLAQGPDYVPQLAAAEQALLELVGAGELQRVPLGHDALWLPADAPAPSFGDRAAAIKTAS